MLYWGGGLDGGSLFTETDGCLPKADGDRSVYI